MMRCPSCASEVPAKSRSWLSCGGALGSATALATVAMAASATPSSSSDEARVSPGTLLAHRYRIVRCRGRRRRSFLPSGDVRPPKRFRGEVRTARPVSHPYVRRVYDIGKAESLAFLTIEYVDGEDLASLLRRIGPLPNDSTVEISRKLCARLAAHQKLGNAEPPADRTWRSNYTGNFLGSAQRLERPGDYQTQVAKGQTVCATAPADVGDTLPAQSGTIRAYLHPADFSTWYAGSAMFHTARAGRPMFGEGMLER